MLQDMELDQVQIDEFWSFIKKKEHLTPLERKEQELGNPSAEDKGDRWSFTAVLPRSGFVHTVHTGKRNSEQAKIFTEKIKYRSNQTPPLFLSDAWAYANPLFETYSHYEQVSYSGRGRPRNPIRVVDEQLKYGQVYKKRDSKGRIEKIETRIIKGEEQEILDIIAATSRGATKINTSFVEGKNGTYRKDNARLTRKSACHSKKAIYHDSHIYFLTGVFNFCRENIGLREEINPKADLFEQKYRKISPAMHILYGIDLLKNYKINVSVQSKNLLNEFSRYVWVKKDGENINKPIDRYNHAIDALRYYALIKLETEVEEQGYSTIMF